MLNRVDTDLAAQLAAVLPALWSRYAKPFVLLRNHFSSCSLPCSCSIQARVLVLGQTLGSERRPQGLAAITPRHGRCFCGAWPLRCGCWKRGGVRRWRISQPPEVLSTSLGSPVSLAEPESQPPPTSSINTPDGSTGHAGRGLERSAPQKEEQPGSDDDAEVF